MLPFDGALDGLYLSISYVSIQSIEFMLDLRRLLAAIRGTLANVVATGSDSSVFIKLTAHLASHSHIAALNEV